MGVQGLFNVLKSIQKPTHLQHFAGKTLGVDAYGWLHRGAVSCAVDLAVNGGSAKPRWVDFAMHRVRMLVHFGVTPYLVFDGDRLPSKAGIEHERAESRRKSRTAGIELLRLGKKAQAQHELQKAIDITPEMTGLLIEELRRNSIKFVVAPYEADAQLAYFEQQGIIDGILSEDSDLLVFGAKTLLTKLDKYGECVMIRQADFTACREISLVGWTLEDFRRMAILSGCDYLKGIPKVGLKTAHELLRKCKTLERTIQFIQLNKTSHVPTDYLARFNQAEMTFLYQWVYCPTAEQLVNLTPAHSPGQLEGLAYIGQYVEPAIAKRVADGQLSPMTKLPIHIEWPRNYNRPPLMPVRAGKENASVANNKKIDSFFKPASGRIPLSELDPNTFHPSPSQQQLLDQNRSGSWTTVRAPRAFRSTQEPRPVSTPETGLSSNFASGQQSRKRQRLCAYDELGSTLHDALTEKSKFFSASTSKTSAVSMKKSKWTDIEIWSDDSVADAMADLPDIDSFISKTNQASSLRGGSRQFHVFKDNSEPGNCAEPESSQQANPPKSEDSQSETPFTAELLAQTRALRNKSRSGVNITASKPQPEASEVSPPTSSNQHQEPMTPPPSHLANTKFNSLPEGHSLEPITEISETPLHSTKTSNTISLQANHPLASHEDPVSSSGKRTKAPCAPATPPTAKPLSTIATQPKGTEDLFIVPDSDAETNSEYAGSPVSSPSRRIRADADKPGNEDEEEDMTTPRPAARLNLSRFAFGSTLDHIR